MFLLTESDLGTFFKVSITTDDEGIFTSSSFSSFSFSSESFDANSCDNLKVADVFNFVNFEKVLLLLLLLCLLFFIFLSL